MSGSTLTEINAKTGIISRRLIPTIALIDPNVTATLPTHTTFVELQQGKSDRPDLQSASKVVSGGRALGSAEE